MSSINDTAGMGTLKDVTIAHRMDPPDTGQDPMPESIEPMKATLSELPPDDEAWGYEIEWDGIRAVAYGEPGKRRLGDRDGRDVTRKYPEIGQLTRQIGAHRVVLDGELVAFDGNRPSFEKLQPRLELTDEAVIRRRRREIPAQPRLAESEERIPRTGRRPLTFVRRTAQLPTSSPHDPGCWPLTLARIGYTKYQIHESACRSAKVHGAGSRPQAAPQEDQW